jgi:hypothetical protein
MKRAVLIPWLALLLGALLVIGFTWQAAMTAPYWDAWNWFEGLRQYRAGDAGLWRLLIRTQNEHPYGLPGVIFILFGMPWGYDLKALSVLTALVTCLNAGLVFIAARRVADDAVALVAVVLVCLSLRSAENLLYGFQLGFPLTVTFGLLAIHGALLQSARGLALMALSLVAGGFCSAAFLAAYPVALSALFIRRSRWSWIGTLVVLVIATAWLFAYLPHLTRPRLPPPDFAARIEGLLILAGSPLVEHIATARAIGALVLLAFAGLAGRAVLRGSEAEKTMALIGGFSLGLIVIVAVGRGTMGGINPSRYANFGAPLIAALCVLAMARLRPTRLPLTAAVLLGFAWAGYDGIREARQALAREAQMSDVLLNNRQRSDAEIKVLNPRPASFIRPLIAMMEAHRYGPFRHPERYALAGRPAAEFSAHGASVQRRPDGLTAVAGRGHVAAGAACTICMVRIDLADLSVPDSLAAGSPTGETRNLGLIFYDDSNRVLMNTAISLEGVGPTVSMTAAGPPRAVRFEAYIYSPRADRMVIFGSMTLATPRS